MDEFGLSRADALRKLVTNALSGAGYLTLRELDEESAIDGTA